MRPPLQHSHPLPTSLVPPSSFCQRGDTTKTGTPQNPPNKHTRDQPSLPRPKHHPPPPRGTPSAGLGVSELSGTPKGGCPRAGGPCRAGVPGLWARCRCPLPVPARPGLGVAHILPLPRAQSPGRGQPWAGRAPRCVSQEMPASAGCSRCCGTAWGPHTDGESRDRPCVPFPFPSLCRGLAAVPIPVPIYPSPHTSSCTREDINLVASCQDHRDNEIKTLQIFPTHHKFKTKIQVRIFSSCSSSEPDWQGPAGPHIAPPVPLQQWGLPHAVPPSQMCPWCF